jgi:hypothetical protein
MALTGNEVLQVTGIAAGGAPSGQSQQTTTGAIANLAGSGSKLVITALNTVGAGTITAAMIIGGIVARGGTQSNTAFTDTTATGAQLDAALTNPAVGQSWIFTYENTTDANATLSAGASGVTLSGISVVYSKTTARFLVTRTAAATYTIVGFEQTVPFGAFGTFTANGTTAVTVTDSRVTANSSIDITLKTVGGTVGAIPSIKTITAGTGFTISGTASDTSVYNYLIVG